MTGLSQKNARHGRYVAVGLCSSGRPAPAAAATLKDDTTIIVVMDSATGEVRRCGDVSGCCTKQNPWTRQALDAPVLPVKHAADLVRELTAASNATWADDISSKR